MESKIKESKPLPSWNTRLDNAFKNFCLCYFTYLVMHNGCVCQMHVLSIFGRDIRHCRLEDPSRFEQNICWEVWKMRFWKAFSLGPHYVVTQQNLGIKTCSDFFSVIRGHLTQGIHFLYAIYKAFQKTEPRSDFTKIRPMLSAAACGPWVLPYTKTLVFLCPLIPPC